MEGFISQTRVSYEFPSEIVYEHKFDTAIRDTFAAKFEERYARTLLTPLDKAMLSLIPKSFMTEPWKKDCGFAPRIFLRLLGPGKRVRDQLTMRRKMTTVTEAIRQTLEIQWSNMLKNYTVSNKQLLTQSMNRKLNDLKVPDEVTLLLDFALWMSTVVDGSAKLKRKQGKMTEIDFDKYLKQNARYEYPPLNLVLVVGDGVCCLILDDAIWLIPSVCILMLHNKACDQISVLMFADATSGSALPPDAYTITVGFIRELCWLGTEYKQSYFDIAKSLESLCVAETLRELEEWTNMEFLRVTSNDVYEATGFDYMGSNLRTILTSVKTPFRHELCCLGKIIGHPYVSMQAGAQALYDKTHEIYTLNLMSVNKCIGHIKANYIRNHILRNKKWPPCTLEYGGPKALTQAYVRSRDPWDPRIVKQFGAISIDDMIYVNLEPNEKFHKLENIIPYLKDKTITLMRSKVINTVLNESDESKPRWEETRLILAFLLNPKLIHDHKDYIDRYESADDLQEFLDYLVIRVVPKEKELKVQFRGFGCKTYEDRFRALAQEKNAMRFLDDYSDEQAMTLSELEILRRLSTLRNIDKAYPGYKTLYINIDASSWNNHFRKETVDDVMKETLDKIFDTTIFGKTHDAYGHTLYYVPGHPDTYFWEGQNGGIEGLNQDTWVVVYLGQIKTAMDGLNVKYHVLCKGDDLRLAVAIPPILWKHQSLTDIKNDIVSRLSKAMSSFGHKIKVLESYGSSQYLAFSKSASFGKVELPQGFRKIQKCYGSNNAFLATLDEYIGSSYSNAHSTCKVEPNVMPAYIVGSFWSLVYLIHHPTYASCTPDELTSLLLIPSMAGGFPIIYLHNMPVRAESDLLSPFLEIYRYCKRHYPNVGVIMERMMEAPLHEPGDRYTMLYKDPYAIPHDRPQLPSAVLRSAIIPILKRFVKHEDVRELLDACESDTMIAFHTALESVNILNTKILSVLYSATPEGILDELIRKFESARSINELMVRTLGSYRSVKVLRKVVRAESKLQSWRIKKLRGKGLRYGESYYHLVSTCPAESADRIRKFLWRREVTGITMPPLQHQILLTTAFTLMDTPWVHDNHFTYTLFPPSQSVDGYSTDHYTAGATKPFIGYTTRNGMVEPSVHFIDKDPMLDKVKNLLDLVTWTNTSKLMPDGEHLESNCPTLIAKILKTVTTTPLEVLAPFSGVRRSGTVQHHVRAPSFRESIVPNVLSNVYTRILGESNTHTRYRTSPHHYYVNFLHIYCYSVWACHWELECGRKITTPEKIWVITTPCEYCNRPIEETPLVFNLLPLGGVSLHPLAISRLGQIAENILRTSIEVMETRNIDVDTRQVEGIPYDVACVGILQEILEQTYHTRSRVMTRYEVPSMTEEAYSVLIDLTPKNKGRDVGQSEVKRIPVGVLSEYIATLVVRYVGESKRPPGEDQIDLILATVPAEDFPWYGLLLQVHKAGKLPELVLHFSKMIGTALPTCFYNVVSATRYIGRCSPMLVKLFSLNFPIVVLSYYTPSQLGGVIGNHLFGTVIHLIKSKITKYLPKTKRTEETPITLQEDDLLKLFLQSLVFCSVLYHVNDIGDEIAEEILTHRMGTIKGAGVEHLTDVMMDDFLNEDTGYIHYITSHLKMWACLGFTLQDVKDRDDWEDIIDTCTFITRGIDKEIHYTNLGHCCLKIRAHPVEEDSDSDILTRHVIVQTPVDPDLIEELAMDRPFVGFRGQDHIDSLSQRLPDRLVLTAVERIVPFQDLFTPLGGATGSETHLLYLLGNMGKSASYSNDSLIAACLADGFGGFTNALAGMYRGSTIVYHTLVEDTDSTTIPVSMLQTETTAEILSRHLEEGHDNLAQPSTYLRISQYNLLYDIITCDLELADDELFLTSEIYKNLLEFYLMSRTRECIGIFKVDIHEHETIARMVTVLIHYTVTCGIVCPRSTDSSKYLYVVSRGWRRSVSPAEFAVMWEGPFDTQVGVGIERYFKQVKSQRRKFATTFERGFDCRGLDHGVLLRPWIMVLGLQHRLTSLIQNSFHIPMVIESTDLLPDTIGWGTRMLSLVVKKPDISVESVLGFDLRAYLRKLWEALENEDGIDLAVRRHTIVCHIFQASIVRYILESYVNMDSPFGIVISEINEVYEHVYQRLLPRDRRGRSNVSVWASSNWEHEGTMILYNSYFKRGLKIGFVFLGTMAWFIKYNAREIAEHRKNEQS